MSIGSITKLFKGDRIVWCVFFIMCILSLIEVFSASSSKTFNTSFWNPIITHSKFILAGVFIAWFTHTFKIEWIKDGSKWVYVAGIASLIYALFNGVSINVSRRWIYLFGVQFQHFEIVKLGVVMLISVVLARAQTDERTFLSWKAAISLISKKLHLGNRKGDYTMLFILIAVLIPCAFIITENLSTVVIILLVSYFMMFIGRVNWKHMLGLIGIGAVTIIIGVSTLLVIPESFKEYGSIGSKVITWKHRIHNVIESFGSNNADEIVISGNEQMVYSKVAIAEGGVTGRGPGNSVRRDFIPHAYNDFIFAIILEELGLLGGIFTVILYLTLLYRCGIIARDCDDPFAIFLVTGIGILICMQAMMHMTISVTSFVSGQPLPLISQGGTSFIINCVYIGIIQCISKYANRQNREAVNGPEVQTK